MTFFFSSLHKILPRPLLNTELTSHTASKVPLKPISRPLMEVSECHVCYDVARGEVPVEINKNWSIWTDSEKDNNIRYFGVSVGRSG